MSLDPPIIPVINPDFARVWQAHHEAAARGNAGSVADATLAGLLMNALQHAYQYDTPIEAGLLHNGIDPDTLARL